MNVHDDDVPVEKMSGQDTKSIKARSYVLLYDRL